LTQLKALGEERSFTSFVNPFIGTRGSGNLFPGASTPFGMVAPSPDEDRSFPSGYHYDTRKILGFSNTHISGAGIPELGDVLLLPIAGTPWSAATANFSTGYVKASEMAKPGWYQVTLTDNHVTVDLTATQRVALQRYRFSQPGNVQVLADFQHGLLFTREHRVTDSAVATDATAGEIFGTVNARNWVERETSFVLRFNHPIEKIELLPPRDDDKAPRYLLTFDLKGERELQARVAFSTVDVAGARLNLSEADGRDFDQIRRAADRSWNKLLGRVEIDGSPDQMRIFYSALYHAMLHPSDIADRDGKVRGPTGQVISAKGGVYYSTLSLWDIYRGQFPLLTIIAPERVDPIIETMIEHARMQGTLPVWTVWGRETWCMTGNPALPLIATAVADGFHGFDLNEALQAMVVSSTNRRQRAPDWTQIDWDLLAQYGYLPFDVVQNESISVLEEIGVSDDAVARVARAAGMTELAERFAARALYYRNVFDPDVKLARGKDRAGHWRTPFDPVTPTSPLQNPGDYTEGNAWQYTLTAALHDPDGLVALIGGRHAFGNWMDEFFQTGGLTVNVGMGQEAIIGQYAHGNEPSHHVAYLYGWTDRPWHGHLRIQQIYRSFYGDKPDGIVGNDDAGQMSSWFVFSTLGFYPVVPASGSFTLGAPQVKSARIHLPKGKVLRIDAKEFSDAHPYAAVARLNGRAVNPITLPYRDIMRGGSLVFAMRTAPDTPMPSVQ
jgi:predicted alpha-1,2-mannosidase